MTYEDSAHVQGNAEPIRGGDTKSSRQAAPNNSQKEGAA